MCACSQPKREPSEQECDLPDRADILASEIRERERERDTSSKESTPQRTFGRKRKRGAAVDNMSSAASTCSEDSMSERGSDIGGECGMSHGFCDIWG